MLKLKFYATMFALFIGLLITFNQQASAATISVNSLSDTQANDGGCTLREAIINANANNQTGSTDCVAGAGVDTINITIAGTIELLTPLPNLTTGMTINGLSADLTTVKRSAATEFGIFTKLVGTTTISNMTVRDGIVRGTSGATGGDNAGGGIYNGAGQLTVTNVTVTNNKVIGGDGANGSGGFGYGGGIMTDENTILIVSNSIITNNEAIGGNGTTTGGFGLGGGISAYQADVTITNSTISNNTATGGNAPTAGGAEKEGGSGVGGGIHLVNLTSVNISGSTINGNTTTGGAGVTRGKGTGGGIQISRDSKINMTNSTVNNNTAQDVGGGICQIEQFLDSSITNSIISNNVANNSAGGGIYTEGYLELKSSTVSGNSSTSNSGGGIYSNLNSTMELKNSTVSGNSAGGTGNGGGLRNFGVATISNSTFSNNSVNGGTGGGISSNRTLTLNNTIIANSTGEDCVRTEGTVNATYSLIESGLTCVNGTNTNNLTGDPNLGPLQNNGGPTFTHALLPGSIAIDKAGITALTTDQRGLTRLIDIASIPNAPGGNGADIGAFEQQQTPTAAMISISGRVLTDGGKGLMNALVYLTDAAGNVRTARTGAFGYYRFQDVDAGQVVIISVVSKRYQFAPQVISVVEEMTELNFSPQ